MSILKCPQCNASKFVKNKHYYRADGTLVQSYQCKNCQHWFLDKYRQLPVDVTGISCPQCYSSKVVGAGAYTYSDGNRIQRYKCKSCEKQFLREYYKASPRLADKECPSCGSSLTVKLGKPREFSHGKVQPCKCKSCGKGFSIGGRKSLRVFLNGKEIHRCWYPPGIQFLPDIVCPACGQEKAVLKTELKNGAQQGRILVCFGCGRQFQEGTNWNTAIRRRLGEEIPRQSWHFEDETWDLRELYPSIEEHEFRTLFLNFSTCGSPWFTKLVKNYLLWRIQTGLGHTTLSHSVGLLASFGCFLQKQGMTSIEDINRTVLAEYWTQTQGHLSRSTLNSYKNTIKAFLDWGNAEEYFITSPILITTLDKSKIFYNETDPLEDHVLSAIRDNLHILPEPLQLMFMLGFWLGARPKELCYIHKNCPKLDPNGSIWWVEFERQKPDDEHKLPVTTDLVRLIQQQQDYITKLHGEDYPYLFCHYHGLWKVGYPTYPRLMALKRPPKPEATNNPMVKVIRHLIEQCNIRGSNQQLARFTGAILRPSRATQLIREGFSLEFIRIWLKHRSAKTTKRHYTRYRPGELLDVACVMANMDGKFYLYDSNPDGLRQNPELHELDGLKMPSGEPLYGYCIFREFCPRFGHCYTCGFHIASADKLPHYKAQLERLLVKKSEIFNYESSEMLESYTQIVNALEGKIKALENPKA